VRVEQRGEVPPDRGLTGGAEGGVQPDPAPGGVGGGRVAQAPDVGAAALDHVLRLRDQDRLAVTEPRQVVDHQPARLREVEVEDVQPGAVRGQAHQRAGLLGPAQHRQPHVVLGDVEQHHAVDHPRVGDPAQRPGAVGLGDQQDVVAQLAGGVRDAGHVLEHRRGELVLEELREQADHPGLRGGQRASTGVRGVAERADGGLDAGADLRGDRALAGQRVGGGAARDPRAAGDVADRGHRAPPVPRRTCRSSSNRFAR
jgi:hypothetical protein